MSGYGFEDFPGSFSRSRLFSPQVPFPDPLYEISGNSSPKYGLTSCGTDLSCWGQKLWELIKELFEYQYGCVKSVAEYIYCEIKQAITKQSQNCVSPSVPCWVIGTGTIVALVMAALALIYLGFTPIYDTVSGIFGFLTSFVFDVGSYLRPIFGGITGWVKSLIGTAYSWAGSIAEATYSSPYMWYLVVTTALVWAALEVAIEWVNGVTIFKGTKIYEIYEILVYPIEWILDEIKTFVGSGILYGIACGIAFPFEAAIMVLSMFLAMICKIFEEIIGLIKDKST